MEGKSFRNREKNLWKCLTRVIDLAMRRDFVSTRLPVVRE
jgi:hypothetical protein